MAGLYSKKNLGEVQLNLKDGLQKLYETGIQEDLRLFAFANSIFSEVRSGVTRTNADTGNAEVVLNEIKGLINEPFTNENGVVVKRTKFVTNQFTFSSGNLVYFDKIAVSGFDQRQQYTETVVGSDAVAGTDPSLQIKIMSGPAVEVGDRIITNNSSVYHVLDSATAGNDFRISQSAGGTPLTGGNLTTIAGTITVALGAKIRKTGVEGAPLILSENGSIVSAVVTGAGAGYEIERTDRPGGFVASTTYKITDVGSFDWTSIGLTGTAAVGVSFTTSASVSGQDNTKSGSAIRNVPTATAQTVVVNVIGQRSGSSNASLKVKILAGKLSRTDLIEVVDGGSGYFSDEPLKIVEQCRLNRFGQQETPQLQKCKNYSLFQDRLVHRSFKYTVPTSPDEIDYSTAVLGYEGELSSSNYFYQTRDAGEDGFSLYDPITQKDLYLGANYDQQVNLPTNVSTPSLLMRRFDTITSLNLLNLDSLSANARLFDYPNIVFSVSNTLASQIRGLTERVESIRDSFKTLLQNNTRQRLVTDEKNTLGTQYNIFEGRNFDSTFRLIFRDPDGVVDKTDVNFSILNAMDNEDGIETPAISGVVYHAPGIWIKTGADPLTGNALYKRAFSTDDKPFSSSKGNLSLSPILNKKASGDYSTGTFTAASETGDNKYSISTAYLASGGAYVQGFTSNIGTVVQNLSASPRNGGFVYHRILPTATLTTDSGAVIAYPLFDYFDASNIIRSPYILTVQGAEEDN